jgi:hypothetical protein
MCRPNAAPSVYCAVRLVRPTFFLHPFLELNDGFLVNHAYNLSTDLKKLLGVSFDSSLIADFFPALSGLIVHHKGNVARLGRHQEASKTDIGAGAAYKIQRAELGVGGAG